jgi:TetR/AcrR family transcriptional regulator, ethionamide resistance regulator
MTRPDSDTPLGARNPSRPRRARAKTGVRGEEARDVRAEILSATTRLLDHRRLEEITVSDIIEAAGVSRATFYIYFESKYGPVAALAEKITEELYVNFWKPFIDSEEPASRAGLRHHMRQTLTRWNEDQAVLVAAAAAWRADPAAIDQWRELWTRYVADTRTLIERTRARGQAPDGLDAGMLAALLTWMNENVLYLAFTNPGFADHEKLAETQAGIWLRSIFGEDVG